MAQDPAYIRIAEQIRIRWLLDSEAAADSKLPTQEELASQLGVSRSTIVRALSKLVAEGYLHSRQGSGVYVAGARPQPTTGHCIGLIVPHLHAPIIVRTTRGVEREARRRGYQVLLASSEGDIAQERALVHQHIQSGARGIVLYPNARPRATVDEDYLSTWNSDVPVVAVDLGHEGWPCSRVQFDNYRLGYEMTRQLLKHGHQNIAFMHTSPEMVYPSVHDRQHGWEAALTEAGIAIPDCYRGWPTQVRDMGYDRALISSDYEPIVDSLLALDPRPDAVMAWMDVAAAHLILLLTQRGVRVPEEIRVTGFDAEPMISRLFRPLFPTTRPDFARLGELAVEALAASIAGGGDVRSVYYYPVSVCWRDSRTSEEETEAASNEVHESAPSYL